MTFMCVTLQCSCVHLSRLHESLDCVCVLTHHEYLCCLTFEPIRAACVNCACVSVSVFHGWMGCYLADGRWQWLSGGDYTPEGSPNEGTRCLVNFGQGFYNILYLENTKTARGYLCQKSLT